MEEGLAGTAPNEFAAVYINYRRVCLARLLYSIGASQTCSCRPADSAARIHSTQRTLLIRQLSPLLSFRIAPTSVSPTKGVVREHVKDSP
jgi:hypothetical protein